MTEAEKLIIARLDQVDSKLARIEADHLEVRRSIDKARRAVKIALPIVRKMLG